MCFWDNQLKFNTCTSKFQSIFLCQWSTKHSNGLTLRKRRTKHQRLILLNRTMTFNKQNFSHDKGTTEQYRSHQTPRDHRDLLTSQHYWTARLTLFTFTNRSHLYLIYLLSNLFITVVNHAVYTCTVSEFPFEKWAIYPHSETYTRDPIEVHEIFRMVVQNFIYMQSKFRNDLIYIL